jgi:hypothetical protein
VAERRSQQAQQAREELRRTVGFSVADELEKLDRLKKSGSIIHQELTRLRAKLVQAEAFMAQNEPLYGRLTNHSVKLPIVRTANTRQRKPRVM